jgi:hypothetical protein
MKVTVRKCLELQFFKESTVIGGKEGLDNKVTAVSFFDWGTAGRPDLELHKRDEMILTPFPYPDKTVDQLQRIRELFDTGVAVVVIFPLEGFTEDLEKAIAGLSDELGLPVISMPRNTKIAYSDVINEVTERIISGENFGNRLISNTIYHLLNFEKHSNFQSAVTSPVNSFSNCSPSRVSISSKVLAMV